MVFPSYQSLCSGVRKLVVLMFLWTIQLVPVGAQGPAAQPSIDQQIDGIFKPLSDFTDRVIFFSVPIGSVDVLFVVLWLAFAGVFLTVFFRFVNVRFIPLALRTVQGRYSSPDDPGQVTHFQALSAAVSGTVGLGNIAGVAIGVYHGGPGVVFWLFISGFLGMSTKFAECTLGVKYREIDETGAVHGGAMYYLRNGLAERGLAPLGILLSLVFAVCCVVASFGGGNMFQINQTTAQLVAITGGSEGWVARHQWVFGLCMALLTALVIIGGIRGIARVTTKLVPAMCLTYVVSALIVLAVHANEIPGALHRILTEAFTPRAAVAGGMLSAFIWGMRRATFSNEAGVGSAPIAHSTVKTRRPASEGVVALLEPFIDTVVICSLTGLVLCVTMQFAGDTAAFTLNGQGFELAQKFTGDSNSYGIRMTSLAFESVSPFFRYVLFVCVFLFAFSTLITWSFYGLQAWQFLLGNSRLSEIIYKLIFCGFIVVGSAASMDNAVNFSDGTLFAMSIPNLVGVYFLLPVVRREFGDFLQHARKVDGKAR